MSFSAATKITPLTTSTRPDLTKRNPVLHTRGIVLRGNLYHLRVRVPACLSAVLDRREVRCSLRTDNYREALIRGLPILELLDEQIAKLRRELLTEQSITTICARFSEHLHNSPSPAQQAAMLASLTPEQIDRATDQYQRFAEIDQQSIRYGRYHHIEKALDRFAANEGLQIDKSSGNYPLLLQQALLARRDAFIFKYDCALGNRPYLPAVQSGTAVVPSNTPPVLMNAIPVPEEEITLSEMVEKFTFSKHQVDKAWDENTKNEAIRTLATFQEIVGCDIPVRSLTRPMLTDFKNKLALLPAYRHIKADYRDKTIEELLAIPPSEKQLLDLTTRNNQMIWVKSFIEYGIDEGVIPRINMNKLVLSKSALSDHQKDECDPYTDCEVQRIMHNLTYDPGRPERFWGPLLAAHTSGRLNEIGQLYLTDVRKIKGVLYIKIIIEEDQKDKKLKTKPSRRNVPVHPLLLELGFEEYVEGLRKAGEKRLFPKLPKSKRGYGVELGKWFGRTITSVYFPNSRRRKVFNSFRHSFNDKLTNMIYVKDSMQQYLMGHATGKLTFDRYGSDPMVGVLFKVIKRIDYGLNVERLKEIMANPVFSRRGPKKNNRRSVVQRLHPPVTVALTQ